METGWLLGVALGLLAALAALYAVAFQDRRPPALSGPARDAPEGKGKSPTLQEPGRGA